MYAVERRRALAVTLAVPLAAHVSAQLAAAEAQSAGAPPVPDAGEKKKKDKKKDEAPAPAVPLPADVLAGLAALDELRRGALEALPTEDGLRSLAAYLGQLVRLPSRVAASDAGPVYSWFPSETLVKPPPKTPASSRDVRLEAASVLFNVGALASEMASCAGDSSAESLKRACALYVLAAGAFADVATFYAGAVGGPEAPDVTQPVLEALSGALAAQGQACCYARAALPGGTSSDAMLSRLARAAADMFSAAAGVASGVRLRWAPQLEAQAALFRAHACRHRAGELEAAGQYGRALAALAEARAHAGDASSALTRGSETRSSFFGGSSPPPSPVAASLASTVAAQTAKIDAALARARRDNDLIYHDAVPSGGSALAQVSAAALVSVPKAGTPQSPPDLLAPGLGDPAGALLDAFRSQSALFSQPAASSLGLVEALTGPFVLSALAPNARREAVARLSGMRAGTLAAAAARSAAWLASLDAAAAHPALASASADLGTPEDDGQRVPAAAVAAAAAVAELGGLALVEDLRAARDAAKARCASLLREASSALDDEAAADAAARDANPLLQRPPSRQLNVLLMTRLAEGRKQMDAAARTDAALEDEYAKHLPRLVALASGDLEAAVPALPAVGTAVADGGGPAVPVTLGDVASDARAHLSAASALRQRISEVDATLAAALAAIDVESQLGALPEADIAAQISGVADAASAEATALDADVAEAARALARVAADLDVAQRAASRRSARKTLESVRAARAEAVAALVAAQRALTSTILPRLQEGASFYEGFAEGTLRPLAAMAREFAATRAAELPGAIQAAASLALSRSAPQQQFGAGAFGASQYGSGPGSPGGFGPGSPGQYGPGPGAPGQYGPGSPAQYGPGSPGQFGPGQPGGYGPGPNQPGGYGPGPNQPGAYGPGPNQPGGYGPGPNQSGFGPGPNQPGQYGQGPNQPGGYGPGPNQPGQYGPGPNQPGGFGPGPNQPGGYGPGPNQPGGYGSPPGGYGAPPGQPGGYGAPGAYSAPNPYGAPGAYGQANTYGTPPPPPAEEEKQSVWSKLFSRK